MLLPAAGAQGCWGLCPLRVKGPVSRAGVRLLSWWLPAVGSPASPRVLLGSRDPAVMSPHPAAGTWDVGSGGPGLETDPGSIRLGSPGRLKSFSQPLRDLMFLA